MKEHILIADDEKEILSLLRLYLENAGYQVSEASDGETAYTLIQTGGIDLAILDVMMPKLDGYALIRRIRAHSDLPIIVLSARSETTDKIMGLGLGADDYIAKPFSLAVLKARITALLRRSGREGEGEAALCSGAFRLDLRKMKAYREAEELDLSPTELRLLRYFLENKNQVLLKEQILARVWDENGTFVEENILPVNVRRLRRKLGEGAGENGPIKTIHGMGYLWEEK